jgi:L-fuconolactonase
MPVIDAHEHVWDLERSPYPWLASPGLDAIRRTIPFSAGIAHLDSAGIDGSVLVQADDTDADTDLMLEVAAVEPRVAGVVGWLPLDDAARAEDRLAEIASPVLVGVRALIHDMPDPDWILRPEVDAGLGVLERRGLAFDVVAVLPRHLENVVTVAERHPGLTLVVDHLAKPPIGLADREPWWTLIARAAARPNVVAKLSGLYSATRDVAAWTSDQLDPFVDRALDVFGADRLLYGGDWPFSIPAGDYDRTWAATQRQLERLDADERTAILGGNAIRHYRLDAARVRSAAEARRGGAGTAGGEDVT